ncbi:MAG: TetR/AcrR family transcriptional regulator [Nitrospirae bacterium]|nr:TetR/AcrR family transcriptional regulator [Nitrospirota bacterium]
MNKRSGAESKKKILAAARRVFSEYGYKGASMRMIAKSSGRSIGGLYLYFRNKEELYTTLLKARLDDLAQSTWDAVREIQDPTEALAAFILMRVNYARKHRELILIQGKEHGFTFGLKIKRQFFKHQRQVVEEIVRRGIASGEFRECDVGEVSKIIVCALRGFILSIIVEPEALFSPEECSNLILKGLWSEEGISPAREAAVLSAGNPLHVREKRSDEVRLERSGRTNGN